MAGSTRKYYRKTIRYSGVSFMTFILVSACTVSVTFSQNTVISGGTRMLGKNGIIVFNSDITNNGIFSNSGNMVVLTATAVNIEGGNPVSFDNLTVDKGSTINFNVAGQTIAGILLCNGELNAGGNITLVSDENKTALIDGSGSGNIKGNVTMQRYLPSGLGYRYFSSPFQSATVGEFSDDIDLSSTFPPIYRYDENRTGSGWQSYILPANPLYPLSGYSVNFGSSPVPKTYDVTGVVNNGNLSLTVYNHNKLYTRGFNLTGNPYPSPVDWNAASGWTRTNIDNAIYYFKSSLVDQYGGVYSTYMNGVSSDGTATGIIPSMQGFFVHVTDGTWPVTGTLALDNRARITDISHTYLKSAGIVPRSLLRLEAGYTGDSVSFDPFVIYYNSEATYSFDGQLDALKLFNTDGNVTNFYVFGDDGSRLSISAIPFADSLSTFRLGLKTEKNGEITIKIRDIVDIFSSKTIVLSDIVAGTNTVLKPDEVFTKYLIAGDYQNRFFLNIGDFITGVPVTLSDNFSFKVYSSGVIFKAEIILPPSETGLLTISNLTGRILYNRKIYKSGSYEIESPVDNGIYLVTLSTADKRSTKKVFHINR
jgi:hypothetical protein